MSWFKDTVEDWDMVGKALQRNVAREPVRVTDPADEEEELVEVNLDTLRAQEIAEAKKNKRVAETATKHITGD